MFNILKAKNAAVKEFEDLLVKAGWQDGYGLKETYYKRDNSKPLFFRNVAPALENQFKVEIQEQSRIIYIIYNIISADALTANNRQYQKGNSIQIAVDVWSNDAFTFNEDESDQTTVDDIYMDFLSDLINKLIENLWAIEDTGETPEASTSTVTDYLHRNSMIINKKF